ncbi:methyltransferase-like 26 [Microplitis demolitor]|uniref:methyltransferase-like 26 n=1 Tax=Microplitis demolitor TaxID=69319 RepID=UPI0004CD6760|nr:methyltransferase-like 26 [Microplitis demolitor]
MNAIHAIANRRLATESSKKLIYPAADRNKDPILNVLKRIICPGANQVFLEISSGTGQHITHFAPHFPQVTFYPSECEHRLLESISAHVNGLTNVHQPALIDITTNYTTWADGIFTKNSIDYIYNANMMHISPYECSIGLFKNVGELLKPDGTLITYGPYAIDGEITPESNVQFNKSLKSQDPRWGLRDIRDLEKLAAENNLKLVEIFDMPANNKTLIWKKK